MRTHIDEDKLQQYVLEILDSKEQSLIESHIAECSICKKNLQNIRQETDRIGSFEAKMEVPTVAMPKKTNVNFMYYLKIAAVFVIGFALGAILFGKSETEYLTVVRQNIKTVQPQAIFPHFSPFEPVDLNWEIYKVE